MNRILSRTRAAFALATLTALVAPARSAAAQSFTTSDSTIRRIWTAGMDSSHLWSLAQSLLDSVGPRLVASPGMEHGQQWLLDRYKEWGIPARNERYGTWHGWDRGYSHIDLVSPRVRTLSGTMLAWSPGTKRKDVTAPVIILPDLPDTLAFEQWLPNVKGKFVLVSFAEPTCRPDDEWKKYALPGEFERMDSARTAARNAWNARIRHTGQTTRLGTGTLGHILELAGAKGVIASWWAGGFGSQRIFDSKNETAPAVTLSCEDYGLVYRMAERGQNPVLRINAEAKDLGEVPVFNTIAEIKGSEKPDEYVVLSAHFDSWDGASGATDNGTGTLTMLEAMRILKQVYPHPKRTIVVGHWSGEEQGLVGSRAFAADHPEIVKGLQALFNQDNGTGRITSASGGGLIAASGSLATWLAAVPEDITKNITFRMPGGPSTGGTDNASFACYGTPAFGLGSIDWEYGPYTWHTNLDSFDKIVFDELKMNATLVAMLAYEASEDPATVSRTQRAMAPGAAWPTCNAPPRMSPEAAAKAAAEAARKAKP